jgi:hypothetical protein
MTASTAPSAPTPAPTTQPELIGFTLTHALLRTELTVLAGYEPTAGTADVFEDHLRLVTDHLVRHDDEEDQFHFRLLRARAPHVIPLLDRLAAEHRAVADRLVVVRDRSLILATRLDALRTLAALVLGHIAEEDAVVVPLLEQHVTAAEQAESMARSRAKIPPADELRVLAAMLGAATADERRRMLAPLPPEVAALWRTTAGPALDAVHTALGA